MERAYFETIKCADEDACNLEYHNKRIAVTIGMNINLYDFIFPPSDELLKCKVIYNEEGIISIKYAPYEKKEIKNFKLVYDDNIEYSKKSTNRENINKLFEQKQDADEIIIVKNGFVTDTSIANIAVFINGRWLTPKTPLLQGTTRERLLENGEIFEADIDEKMLKSADKIATLNAMVGFNIIDDYKIL